MRYDGGLHPALAPALFLLGLALGVWVQPDPVVEDLQLVNRTLTMAERCTAATETALRALLPKLDTTTAPDLSPGG